MDQQLLLTLVSVCLGIGLSAACGFRIFLPMFIAALATAGGLYTPADGFGWLGGTPALIAFGVATALEIAAYYVPWLDNALDHLGLPVAAAAGTLLAASAMTAEMTPFLHWTLAAIAGGLTASLLHAGTGAARFASSSATLGCLNPLIATGEWVVSGILAVLALFAPVLTAVLAVVLIALAVRAIARRLRARRAAAQPEGAPRV